MRAPAPSLPLLPTRRYGFPHDSSFSGGADVRLRQAQTATSLVFSFTRSYGNHLREGWRNIVDAMLNLHSAQLLQMPQLFALPEYLEPPPAATAVSLPSRAHGVR